MKILTIIGIAFLTGCASNKCGLSKDGILDCGKQYSYDINVKDDLIYISGGINFQLANDFHLLLLKNQNIQGVVLDSYGGNIYPARSIAKQIRKKKLTTYATGECKSSCTIIFLAGKDRFISKYVSFAFHKYNMNGLDANKILLYDIDNFRQQGVSSSFLDQLYLDLQQQDYVYISRQEALNENIAHGVYQ